MIDLSPYGPSIVLNRAILDELDRLAGLVEEDGGGSVSKLSATATAEDAETLLLRDADEITTVQFDGTDLYLHAPDGSSEVDLYAYAEADAGIAVSAGTSFGVLEAFEHSGAGDITRSELKLIRSGGAAQHFLHGLADLDGAQLVVATGVSVAAPGDAAITLSATETDADIEVTGGGVILSSPDGTRYRIKVANGGALSTETVT